MIYESPEGVFVFLYDNPEDAPCVADKWYEALADAEAVCEQQYAVSSTDWTIIDNPMPGCQHDWIHPTRVKVDAQGCKLWGQFERR